MVDTKEQFLRFFETMIKANKQMVDEAWKAWNKKVVGQELYKDGFKEFFIEYLDEQVKVQREKSNIQKI